MEEKELLQKSRAIDKEMLQGHMAQSKVVKLLLLGNVMKLCCSKRLFHK
jgi:hypothetical protein